MQKTLFIVLVVLVLIVPLVVAQDNDMTATPAPSKTPTPTSVPAEDAAADSTPDGGVADDASDTASADTPERARLALVRSFTQDDLQVLVGNVQRPNGFLWLDDYLYAACNGDWTLYRIEPNTGNTITFVFGVQDTHTMYGEMTERGFNLWIPDFSKNELSLVTQNRTAPRTIADDLQGPWGIVALDDEHFLVSNLRGNNIVRINRDGDTQEVMNGLRAPAGLVLDGDYGYVTNNGSARRAIEWFSIADLPDADDESATAITQPFVSGLQNASNLVMGPDGYIYFTYALGTRGVVGRVDPDVCRDEGCTNNEVEIVVYTEMPAPLAGLTISPDARLFIHTIYRPEIYWVDLYR